MNSLLNVRLGQVSCGLALALIGAGAACSSSSAGPMGSTDSGTPPQGETGAPAGDGGMNGSGPPCTPLTDEWVGALITLDVSWAPVLAAGGGTGNIYLWTLNHYTYNGLTVTGTTQTCGNQVPPLVLNANGILATGLPSTTTNAAVLDETPTSKVWGKDTRTATVSGAIGGWNTGSSISLTPITSVSGLAPTSMYSMSTTAWPAMGMTIPKTDLTDDDMDGNVGITAYPVSDVAMGFYLPGTALAVNGQPPPNKADKLYIVSRTVLSLSGTSKSCSETTGTVSVPQYDLHVIGCHDQGASDCADAEWQFIDGNVTIYAGMAGKGTLITGQFDAKQMPNEGATPTCEDVVTMFPSPAPQVQGDN
jgi:hypothetical protein